MTKKRLQELRDLNDKDLIRMREDIQADLRKIRFKAKIERPKNPMEKRNMRIKIAVINTLLKEKESTK